MTKRLRMHPALLAERIVDHLPAEVQISNAYAAAGGGRPLDDAKRDELVHQLPRARFVDLRP